MGTMTTTPQLLTADSERVNINLLAPGDVAAGIDAALDGEIEFLASISEEEIDINEIEYDWWGAYVWGAKQLPDFLADTYPDLFGPGAPVLIDQINDDNDIKQSLGGWGPEDDSFMTTWTIDGAALYALAMDELGTVEVDDGHGISGFYRTAEDDYWTQVRIIRELITHYEDQDSTPTYLAFYEWAREDMGEFVHTND